MRGDYDRNAKSASAGRGPSSGGSDHGAATELTEVDPIDTWAFGTSPYGLGLSEYRFWTMTPREFTALKKVWAEHRAEFYNANFVAKDALPFVAEDFIDPSTRRARQKQAMREKYEVAQEQRRIALMKPGDTSGVPEWALGKVN